MTEPIDMDDVKAKIVKHKYPHVDECLADFDLMFANAHEYNEAGSVIYEDATTLRMVVHEAYEALEDVPLSSRAGGGRGARAAAAAAAVSVGSTKFAAAAGDEDGDQGGSYTVLNDGGQAQTATRQLGEAALLSACQATFESIKTIKGAGETRSMATSFMKMPSRANLAYYAAVSMPLDFITIGTQLEMEGTEGQFS